MMDGSDQDRGSGTSEQADIDGAWSQRAPAVQPRASSGPSLVNSTTTLDESWDEETDWEGFEPVAVEASLLGDRGAYPFASEEDFEDDRGDWSAEDYESTARVLFGDGEFFGEPAAARWAAEGFVLLANNDEYRAAIAQTVPEVARTLMFLQSGELIRPIGFASMQVIERLAQSFPTIDWSGLQVTVEESKPHGKRTAGKLPGSVQATPASDWVDLRARCTPVSAQGQTPRAAAYAWTHAMELGGRLLGLQVPRLSSNHAMAQLHKGAAAALTREGVCTHRLWPDEAPEPQASEAELAREASRFRLAARVAPVSLDQLKTVLAAGCPVVVTMWAGAWLMEVGRDGLLPAWDVEDGVGQHTMLLVGHLGNYFVAKNSWGTQWGDQGYGYIPKKLLRQAGASFQAVIWDRSLVVRPEAKPQAASGTEQEPGPEPSVRQLAAAQAWHPAPAEVARAVGQGTMAGFAMPEVARSRADGSAAVAMTPGSVDFPMPVTHPDSRWTLDALAPSQVSGSLGQPASPATMVGPGSELLPAVSGAGSRAQVPPTMCSPVHGEPGLGAAGSVVGPASAAAAVCGTCGAPGHGSKYCQRCGTRMEMPTRFCIQCGSRLREGVRFCTHCAAPVQ